MKKIFIYLSIALPLFSFAKVEELRAILAEDLSLHIKINDIKKEQAQLSSEIELAMQNARALISLYEQKAKESIEKNKEKDFKKTQILNEINALEENITRLETNVEKIYKKFVENLERIPPVLREEYKKQLYKIENTSYANSSELSFAKLKFLSKLSADANSYQLLDKNTLAFGLNTEFYKESAKGDELKLFKIIDGESGFEILELQVEKGTR